MSGAEVEAFDITEWYKDLWRTAQSKAAGDPFTNAYQLFALDINERLDAGDTALVDIEDTVQAISAEGFLARTDRLTDYLDVRGGAPSLTALFERLAEGGFGAYAARLSRPPIGLVTTGHPTFALSEALSLALVELATGFDADGAVLTAEGRAERETFARSEPHGPPPTLTLDEEARWSLRALSNTADALDAARREALAVARAHWPDRWTSLRPALMSLATWVGFDQDGRNDVTWVVGLGKRLELKAAALDRYLALARPLGLATITDPLERAAELVAEQVEALRTSTDDPASVAAFSRLLVKGRDEALVDAAPLLAAIDTALGESSDDNARETLIVLRANLETQGVCLAHIHVRLNSSQLHNAVRREVGLETSPADPANRRSYFQAVAGLIEACKPVDVGFQSLLAETASARRLFMTIAQMARYVDAGSPVRFLIAETESGFTLLAALYLARLFGVEDLVEISPLFETEEGLSRGELIIEEALRSEPFRAYLKAQGKLALEFGFSDSGRFIGQMAATFRIERLRLRIAELMEREGLSALQLILFNTHGESIGRGGHPASLADRLAYAAPPQNRAAFAGRGISVREEDSFQGGEGYLPLFTLFAAKATVAGLLAFGMALGPEANGDPIYAAQNFAAEFFATVQQAFGALAGQENYAALLSLFGTRLLNKTGSRPDQRQSGETGAVRTFTHVSQLRAIPNNGILQGLGDLANTTYGVERAAAKDPHTFLAMRESSPRFRRALAMADLANALSDLQATRAYAATMNPSLWLDQMDVDLESEALLRRLTRLCEQAAITGKLSDVLRHRRVEPQMQKSATSERRERTLLLHALRIALIQRIARLAALIPPFTPRAGFTLEDAQLQLMRLDVKAAVETLSEIFPLRPDPTLASADFGEGAAYAPSENAGYAMEHEDVFQPILQAHAILLRATTALNHECGACG